MKIPYFPTIEPEKVFELIQIENKLHSDSNLRDFIQECNEKYYAWDTFSNLNLPTNEYSHKQLWSYLKLFCRRKFKSIKNLVDKKDKPFWFTMTDTISKSLHEIDMQLSDNIILKDLDIEKSYKDDWARKRIISSLINEAITSSQIEGAAVTRRKAKELIRSGNKPKNRDEKMIINNYLTIHRIKSEFYKEKASDELLSQIHIQLTEDNTLKDDDVGRFREDVDEQDVVCVYDDDGKVLHEPPNAEMLPKYLADLYQFMNDEREFVHPVLKAIIIHFAIGYIHPYYDGNGRIARALFYWYLIKKGYRLFEFISISEQIKNSVGQYKRAYLYTEIDDNDLTYFINYQLKVINICIKDLKIYINKQVKELKRIKESVKDIPGINSRQLDLLNHALKHPDYRYTIKAHQTSNGISWATARTDLMSLAQKMLLDQKKLGKELHFFIPKNLADKIQNISSA